MIGEIAKYLFLSALGVMSGFLLMGWVSEQISPGLPVTDGETLMAIFLAAVFGCGGIWLASVLP